MPVFGLLKCGGKAHVAVVPNAASRTPVPIIRVRTVPDSIVYTDSFSTYDLLDVSVFRQRQINHRQKFADGRNRINGIENFCNQAKRHLRRYNGIPRMHFQLYLKECEWRFNYRPTIRLLSTLTAWLDR